LLRMLFGEEPREWTGQSLQTIRQMEQFASRTSELAKRFPTQEGKYRTLAISAIGLLSSMNELEQSCYAAKRYAGFIRHNHMDELSYEDRLSYDRHVYYDKNAYIRLFAVLDKLGMLLNQLLNLRTERMKSRFSYFTMLRNLRENRLHLELMKPLYELKERHQGAMSRLRIRRNLEIHQMNAELKDDLLLSLADNEARRTIEDLGANMTDLEHGWEMVEGSLSHSFDYACKWLRNIE